MDGIMREYQQLAVLARTDDIADFLVVGAGKERDDRRVSTI